MQNSCLLKRGKMPKIRKPTTKLEDVVNFYKEIKATENLAYARLKAGVFDENEAFSFRKGQRKKILERYEKLLELKDCYFFKSLSKLKLFMNNYFDSKDVGKIIEHEKRHYQQAKKEGYKPAGFLCWLALNADNKIDYICSTRIHINKMMRYDAYIKIVKASKKMSYIDRMS